MMFIKKRILLTIIFITLPYTLIAWGDGDKLNNGSCKFDLETGYISSSLHLKNNEGFLILNGGDSRYGTSSTIYDALSCEKITSGDSIKSNFSGLMTKRGFEIVDISSNLTNTMDKSFNNIINFSKNQNNVVINIKPIDMTTSKELRNLLKALSQKSASANINISHSAKNLISNERFYNKYLNTINSLHAKKINYAYALALNTKLKNNSKIEMAILSKFFNLNVKNIKDVPQWSESMTQFGKQRLTSSFGQNIMKLLDFGKKLTLNNFLTSIEYRYVLKNLKLKKINKIENDDSEYGITLNYQDKNIRLTNKPTCTSTGRTSESEFSCGFLWGNTCVGTYADYNCKGDTTNIANIERKLMGTVTVAKALNKGWRYQPRIARRTKASSSSSSSGIGKNQCYKISEYGPRNICLKGTRGDACHGLKDYALRKVCLEGTGGNACYAFKDYAKQKICSEGIRTDACYSISNNYNKQKSCREFSGDTDIWLIISSYGYYTWK